MASASLRLLVHRDSLSWVVIVARECVFYTAMYGITSSKLLLCAEFNCCCIAGVELVSAAPGLNSCCSCCCVVSAGVVHVLSVVSGVRRSGPGTGERSSSPPPPSRHPGSPFSGGGGRGATDTQRGSTLHSIYTWG